MLTPQDLVDNYLAIWNETDEAARKQLINKTWADNLTYVDPTSEVVGHEGLNQLITGFQSAFPDLTFRQIRETEAHHDLMRSSWELANEAGETIAGGTDVAVVREDKILTVGGFYDQAPVLDAT